MLNIEDVATATATFAEQMGWVAPPAPKEGCSEKAIELGMLIDLGGFGCRASHVRKIVGVVIGEELPPPTDPTQKYTSLNAYNTGENVLLTLTTDYANVVTGQSVLVDAATRKHSSEILSPLLPDGGRGGYFDYSYLRPATKAEQEAFVNAYNEREAKKDNVLVDELSDDRGGD